MIEFGKKHSSGLFTEATVVQRVSEVNLPDKVQSENAADVVYYALAHTFKRADNLDDIQADLTHIINRLSVVRDNINPFWAEGS